MNGDQCTATTGQRSGKTVANLQAFKDAIDALDDLPNYQLHVPAGGSHLDTWIPGLTIVESKMVPKDMMYLIKVPNPDTYFAPP